MTKTALITGITGQDGYYLTKLLLEQEYEVHGIVRRSSSMNRQRIDQLCRELPDAARNIHLHYGDLTDANGLMRITLAVEPDEIYNLAAQSHVRVSFDKPNYTSQVNTVGALNVLEAARELVKRKPVRVYQASTSEMFGGVPGTAPQNEQTPFQPKSPYACAKVAAFHQTVNYREAYGVFACNGILFNHESPMRGENFVTRKITLGVSRIKEGLQEKLALGNLEAKRDWGFADDYVKAMWLMLQQPEPDDFVIATGETHTVQEFLEAACRHLNVQPEDFVITDPRLYRPAEVEVLCGDASRAERILGWKPQTSFDELVRMMVEADLQTARREKWLASRPMDS